MIKYRNMIDSDIPEALALCRHAGWNQLERDWRLFLELSAEGCFVAEDEDGKVIGTSATISYNRQFSWIGMVLVHPSHKRKGIGTQLLNEALNKLYDEKSVKLDATPAGREIYLKLDFKDEFRLSRMVNASVNTSAFDTERAEAMSKNDLEKICGMDSEIFGADRSTLLHWMWEGAPEFAFLLHDENGISGYCFGRYGFNHIHIGPVIANDSEDGMVLIAAALRNSRGRSVIIDMTHFNRSWNEKLISAGFIEQRPFIRMYKGVNKHAGQPEKQMAILGPEFG